MKELFNKLKIKPNKLSIFMQSLTHKTFINENKNESNYENLEFLGDAILQMESSLFIYEHFKNINEGEMTLLRSRAVNTDNLAKHTAKIGLHKYMRLGKGAQELKNNKSIMADIFESFLAAIYLDQGIKMVRTFLENTIFKDLKNSDITRLKDAKTVLQEFLQSSSRKAIQYKTVKKGDGFVAEIKHDNHLFGVGSGKTKKEAETNAAKEALSMLNNKGGQTWG